MEYLFENPGHCCKWTRTNNFLLFSSEEIPQELLIK